MLKPEGRGWADKPCQGKGPGPQPKKTTSVSLRQPEQELRQSVQTKNKPSKGKKRSSRACVTLGGRGQVQPRGTAELVQEAF